MMMSKVRGVQPGGALLLVAPDQPGATRVASRLRNAMIGVKHVTGIHDERYAELTETMVQVLVVDPDDADLDRALRQLGRERSEVHLMTAAPRREDTVSTDREAFVTCSDLAHPVFKPEASIVVPPPDETTEDEVEVDDDDDPSRQGVDEEAVKRMLASGIIG